MNSIITSLKKFTNQCYCPFTASDEGDIGLCGKILTILSLIVVACTFPLSLFFCLKVNCCINSWVSLRYLGVINLNCIYTAYMQY